MAWLMIDGLSRGQPEPVCLRSSESIISTPERRRIVPFRVHSKFTTISSCFSVSERFVPIHAHSSFLFSIIFGNVSGPFMRSLHGRLPQSDRQCRTAARIDRIANLYLSRSLELIYSPAKCWPRRLRLNLRPFPRIGTIRTDLEVANRNAREKQIVE